MDRCGAIVHASQLSDNANQASSTERKRMVSIFSLVDDDMLHFAQHMFSMVSLFI
jgi:hypothetical protein